MNEIAGFLIQRVESPLAWTGLTAIALIALSLQALQMIKSWREYKDGYHDLDLEKRRLEIVKLKIEIDLLGGSREYPESEKYEGIGENINTASDVFSIPSWAKFLLWVSPAVSFICSLGVGLFGLVFSTLPVVLGISGHFSFGQAALVQVAFWLIAFLFWSLKRSVELLNEKFERTH